MATAPTTHAAPARPQRDPARRAQILQAAAEVFAHAGYAATSVDDVAAAAGITKLIVYRHFATKEALYRAVCEQVFARQAELFLASIDDGLQAAGTVSALLTAGRELPDGFRLLWRHAVREPQFAAYAHELRDTAVDAARAVVAPFVPPGLTEWAAQTLFDHLVDAVLNWLDHGAPAADDDFVAMEAAALAQTVAAWAGAAPGRQAP
jgi:AcrR family transcriptional regulator